MIQSNMPRKGNETPTNRPAIGPKPQIASKPKFIPPIKKVPVKVPGSFEKHDDDDRIPTYSLTFPDDVKKSEKDQTNTKTAITSEQKRSENSHSKENSGSNSPNTVCCSILQNTSTSDCCGMLSNSYKKELQQKKIQSTDSVSSDSGGFKEFILRDSEIKRLEAEQSRQFEDAKQPRSHPKSHHCDPRQLNQQTHQHLIERQHLHEQTQQLIKQTKEMSEQLEMKIQQMAPFGQTQQLTQQFQHQWNQQSQQLNQQLHQLQTHQRKVSQPEFLNKNIPQHQRKTSQPDYLVDHSVAERAQLFKQNMAQSTTHQRKKSQTDIISQELRQLVGNRREIFSQQQILPPRQFSVPHSSHPPVLSYGSSEVDSPRSVSVAAQQPQQPVKPLIAHGQFQQNTKKLEELLAQRVEKDKQLKLRKSGVLSGEGENPAEIEQQINVQKQIQQKLQGDLKQQMQQIQELKSLELRLPQNLPWPTSTNEVSDAYVILQTEKIEFSN